nr:PREDICTED: uncharacterized protein LOC107398454 [Tribolium castaneum]|eukprot:XP_015838040.1 PREDICTED: uncharacterized protein LOC107398454 [Tribolium castaneum]
MIHNSCGYNAVNTVLFLIFYTSAAGKIQQFKNASIQFTISVYKELSKCENGNFVVSPFSVEATLALAKTAFKGESLQEIRNVLHLSDDKDKLIIQSLSSEANSKFYNLHTGSKIYVKKDIPIKEKFKNTSQVFYEIWTFPKATTHPILLTDGWKNAPKTELQM